MLQTNFYKEYLHVRMFNNWLMLSLNLLVWQAFKLIVTDPDSVLNSLTREVKEIGPDGQEVMN